MLLELTGLFDGRERPFVASVVWNPGLGGGGVLDRDAETEPGAETK